LYPHGPLNWLFNNLFTWWASVLNLNLVFG
jgi:hypothetical protein